MSPQSQSELLNALIAIFPEFEALWVEEREDDFFPSDSLHCVYQSFLPFASVAPASQDQLRRLCALVNEAVADGGDAENAVDTCFLEHLHQVGLVGALRPFLSAQSCARLHT